MTSQHKDLTIQYKDLTRRHKDLTSQDSYLRSDGRNMLHKNLVPSHACYIVDMKQSCFLQKYMSINFGCEYTVMVSDKQWLLCFYTADRPSVKEQLCWSCSYVSFWTYVKYMLSPLNDRSKKSSSKINSEKKLFRVSTLIMNTLFN